jgi:hypothetical protein
LYRNLKRIFNGGNIAHVKLKPVGRGSRAGRPRMAGYINKTARPQMARFCLPAVLGGKTPSPSYINDDRKKAI